jgi:ABC-2 type transport system ATP-binding protein
MKKELIKHAKEHANGILNLFKRYFVGEDFTVTDNRYGHRESAPALEIRGLCKEFESFALKDVDLLLERGYVMGLIGPNGSGKTTTIKLIMNLLRKDKGDIKVLGLDHVKDEKTIKNRIGFVYDENYYYGVLSIAEMKNLIAPLYENWKEEQFQKYMQKFDLNPAQKIDKLSKGMKIKFSLAMALSHEAELIIMDEPTSGLDPIFRSEFLDILYDLMQDERKSILFSTHITSDLERIADYITFLHNGEIVFSSQKDDLQDKYALIKGPADLLHSTMESEFIGLRKSSVGFEGLIERQSKIKQILRDKITVEKPSLDDMMIYLAQTRRR